MEYTQFASIAGVYPPGFSSGYRIGLRGRGHYPSDRVRCARLFVVTAEPGIPDLVPGLRLGTQVFARQIGARGRASDPY